MMPAMGNCAAGGGSKDIADAVFTKHVRDGSRTDGLVELMV